MANLTIKNQNKLYVVTNCVILEYIKAERENNLSPINYYAKVAQGDYVGFRLFLEGFNTSNSTWEQIPEARINEFDDVHNKLASAKDVKLDITPARMIGFSKFRVKQISTNTDSMCYSNEVTSITSMPVAVKPDVDPAPPTIPEPIFTTRDGLNVPCLGTRREYIIKPGRYEVTVETSNGRVAGGLVRFEGVTIEDIKNVRGNALERVNDTSVESIFRTPNQSNTNTMTINVAPNQVMTVFINENSGTGEGPHIVELGIKKSVSCPNNFMHGRDNFKYNTDHYVKLTFPDQSTDIFENNTEMYLTGGAVNGGSMLD